MIDFESPIFTCCGSDGSTESSSEDSLGDSFSLSSTF